MKRAASAEWLRALWSLRPSQSRLEGLVAPQTMQDTLMFDQWLLFHDAEVVNVVASRRGRSSILDDLFGDIDRRRKHLTNYDATPPPPRDVGRAVGVFIPAVPRWSSLLIHEANAAAVCGDVSFIVGSAVVLSAAIRGPHAAQVMFPTTELNLRDKTYAHRTS